jgi:hypothetical protein
MTNPAIPTVLLMTSSERFVVMCSVTFSVVRAIATRMAQATKITRTNHRERSAGLLETMLLFVGVN